MTTEEILTRVMERTGLEDLEDARKITASVLAAVAQGVAHRTLQAVRDELPDEIADLLGPEPDQRKSLSLNALVSQVAAREGVADGFALEHSTAVCEAIAHALRPEALRLLKEGLTDEVAALFTPREEPRPVERVHVDSSHRTLAEGRSGASRPLYAARADNAHSESVARSDNPHGDTKLSSAKGLTQEREEETLATGKPGSTRPVSTHKR